MVVETKLDSTKHIFIRLLDLEKIPAGHVRIAFDGDASLFDESSEIVYKAKGIGEFLDREDRKQDVPMVARNLSFSLVVCADEWLS